jgi:hypothetical protein
MVRFPLPRAYADGPARSANRREQDALRFIRDRFPVRVAFLDSGANDSLAEALCNGRVGITFIYFGR